jgi:hypothetical protein
MFEMIQNFLQSFKIYERYDDLANVGEEFKRATHAVMICFVDICSLYIDRFTGSKRKELLANAKMALFNHDSGIKNKMSEFRDLVDYNDRISGAVTLEQILKSRHNSETSFKELFRILRSESNQVGAINDTVGNIYMTQIEEKTERTRQDRIKMIREKLDFYEESVQPKKILDQMTEQRVEGSGDWLKENSIYRSWLDYKSSTNPILLLHGNSGTGKSFLSSYIASQLKSPTSSDGVIPSVAYYNFPDEDNKDKRNEEIINNPHSPATALKSMALQLAYEDETFAAKLKNFLERLNEPLKNSNYEKLIEALELALNRKGSVFLIFDGFDHVSFKNATDMFDTLENLSKKGLRIVATGVETAFTNLRRDLTPHLVIKINEYNKTDVVRFIEKWLQDQNLLQGSESESVEVRDLVLEKLPKNTDGSFSSISRSLQNIKQASNHDDVRQLVQLQVIERDKRFVERILDTLNSSLTPQEIDQVNVLLVWVIYANWTFDIDDLQAAWFVRHKSPLLQPLETIIREKYSKIFDIHDGDVVTDERIEGFMKDSNSPYLKTTRDDGDEARISLNLTINRVGVSTVRRFLWDLAEAASFDRFPFETIDSGIKSQKCISASPAEAELMIVQDCIDVLLKEPNAKTEPIAYYALFSMYRHLENLINLEDKYLGAAEIVEVGRELMNLFSDIEHLRLHWRALPGYVLPFLEDQAARTLWKWFKYLRDQKGFSSKDRKWLDLVTANEERKVRVLRDVAVMVSEEWLCTEEDSTPRYRWLKRFIELVRLPQQR